MKSKHLSQITSLTSSYDVAWRKHDFAKYVKELPSSCHSRHNDLRIEQSLLKVTTVFAVCSIKSS